MFPGSYDKVARLVPPNVGTVEPIGDGALVRIGADDVDWLAGYLIGLALPFEILSPVVLRDQVRELAERILRAHPPL